MSYHAAAISSVISFLWTKKGGKVEVHNLVIIVIFHNWWCCPAQEVQKKKAEVEQEIQKQPLNVDTLSKEGFSKVGPIHPEV